MMNEDEIIKKKNLDKLSEGYTYDSIKIDFYLKVSSL